MWRDKISVVRAAQRVTAQDWHKTDRAQGGEVDAITKKPFTRSQRASSLLEQNKSALTDHVAHDNHVITWQASTVLDRD